MRCNVQMSVPAVLLVPVMGHWPTACLGLGGQGVAVAMAHMSQGQTKGQRAPGPCVSAECGVD